MYVNQPPTAVTLGRDLYLSARPEQQDAAQFFSLSQHWCQMQFDKQAGPIFDEVNQLRSAWWHDGSNDAFSKCLAAVQSLGEVLGFPEFAAVD